MQKNTSLKERLDLFTLSGWLIRFPWNLHLLGFTITGDSSKSYFLFNSHKMFLANSGYLGFFQSQILDLNSDIRFYGVLLYIMSVIFVHFLQLVDLDQYILTL